MASVGSASCAPGRRGRTSTFGSEPSLCRAHMPCNLYERILPVGRNHTTQQSSGGGGAGDVSAKGLASEQLCPPREVKFVVPVQVNYGDSVKVVGNESALGNWDYDRGIPLQWSEGNIWSNKVDLNPGAYEFKCVVAASDGELQWEPGSNRTIKVHPEMSHVEVRCEWWNTQCTSSSPGCEATLECMENKTLPTELKILEEPRKEELLYLPSPFPRSGDGGVAVNHLLLEEGKKEDPDDCATDTMVDGRKNDAHTDEQLTFFSRDELSPANPDGSLASASGNNCEMPPILQAENHVVATPAGFPVLKEVLGLVAAGHLLPHFAKRKRGGEDAYFVSGAGQGGMGVADGVGSWANDGVDPARYPRVLIGYIARALNHSDGTVPAKSALEYAQQQARVLGSCTACVGTFKDSNMMEFAILGDCGFRIIREGHVVHASKVQQHDFNHPFQLTHPSLAPGDSATDAEVCEVPVEDGDIVVMGTDGLFHNFWDHDLGPYVAGLCGDAQCTKMMAQSIATSIAEVAHRNAGDQQFYSPWSAESHAQACVNANDPPAQESFLGGKMDDCTVVVGFISKT